MQLSCGVILDTPRGWLVCHATGTTHWDFPKGGIEPGESPLDCAIRETLEETGLDLHHFRMNFVDLGEHAYIRNKRLHMFYLKYDEEIDIKQLNCSSFVRNERTGASYPEVDYYDFVSREEAMRRLGRGLRGWIETNFKESA